jgi:hypothetical protein
MPKNAKHVPTKGQEILPPVSAIDKIPVAIPIASNGFLGYRMDRNPYGLHVAKSNAGRSALHDEEIKPDPMITTDLTLQDDATRLPIMTNNGTNDSSKRKASSMHVHTDSEPSAKRPKNKQDRPAMSETEENTSDDEDRKPAAKDTTPTPDGVPSSSCPSNDEDRKPAAKSTTPTPDDAPSTCAGFKRKSTSTRTGSAVSTRAQGIKLEPVIKTETAPASAPATTDPSTDQVEASIPTETGIDGTNLNLTVTVHRKAAKRSEKWYQNGAGPLLIPARKRRRLEDPPLSSPTSTDEAAKNTAPPDISGGLPTPATPPPSTATVNVSTRRKSRRQTELLSIETSEAQLDGDYNDVNAHVADLSGTSWEVCLSELAEYHKLHGHCNVPSRYCENIQLGTWVKNQRTQMTPSRIQELESLGFKWGDSHSATWEDRLNELADFRKIHGHCNVPYNYSENTKLGRWVGHQRNQYRFHLEGKTSSMTLSRIQELESLGFEWRGMRGLRLSIVPWEDRLNELADFRKIHGHCNVPYNYSENTKLGRWVGTQGKQYRFHLKGKKSQMTLSRIQELERLGFEWSRYGTV